VDYFFFWARGEKKSLLVPIAVFVQLDQQYRDQISYDHGRIVANFYFDSYGSQYCKPCARRPLPADSIPTIQMSSFCAPATVA
jgi:hypothetical protein